MRDTLEALRELSELVADDPACDTCAWAVREIERLRVIVGADDEYLRLLRIGALRSLRGEPAETEKQERMEAWQKCCDAREAAEAARKDGD